MKDRFKREFGATIDDFFDEKQPEPKAQPNNTQEEPTTNISLEIEEGEEDLLEKLLKANELIDSLSSDNKLHVESGVQKLHPNQEEHLRQKVADVLRRLEKEIDSNKFNDVLST